MSALAMPRSTILPNFLYMLTVAVDRSSSDGNAIRHVLPVVWMTSCFHIMAGTGHHLRRRVYMFRPVRQIAAPVGRKTTLFLRDRQASDGRRVSTHYFFTFRCPAPGENGTLLRFPARHKRSRSNFRLFSICCRSFPFVFAFCLLGLRGWCSE